MSEADGLDFSSPTVPDTAVFIAADEPLLVFPTVEAAESYLEAIDVEDGVYSAAYGPNGEPFSIGSYRNHVTIEPTDGPNNPDALKALLLEYLGAKRQPASADSELTELTTAVWKLERRELHGPRFSAWTCLLIIVLIATVLFAVFR